MSGCTRGFVKLDRTQDEPDPCFVLVTRTEIPAPFDGLRQADVDALRQYLMSTYGQLLDHAIQKGMLDHDQAQDKQEQILEAFGRAASETAWILKDIVQIGKLDQADRAELAGNLAEQLESQGRQARTIQRKEEIKQQIEAKARAGETPCDDDEDPNCDDCKIQGNCAAYKTLRRYASNDANDDTATLRQGAVMTLPGMFQGRIPDPTDEH